MDSRRRATVRRRDGRARGEHRGVDGSANPYPAATAPAAAWTASVVTRPGAPGARRPVRPACRRTRQPGVAHPPRTLPAAVDELVADEVLREALGRLPGGDFVDCFAAVMRAEFDEYHAAVSGWEIERYLTSF
ncbi:hypothetical protein [Pseudonocardia sp. H11422]|uniref:hypothetical protein n=1 Tax=Pseudonocardia sp. H11422 TaxID=2835866 RepID=UPI00292FA6D6|nr:hypothetical protein [Pseudonocardia sp. H11422]